MPLPFDPAELAMLTDNGFLGVTREMKEAIAEELDSQGFTRIMEDDLTEACWSCGVDPTNLDQSDISEICRLLERRIRERMEE